MHVPIVYHIRTTEGTIRASTIEKIPDT
ncbi:MAG: hypothetical protein HW374_1013, partial [Bacteroidetes bacterium]|nr:hypothetical protein [Bacteroidota bacterium]